MKFVLITKQPLANKVVNVTTSAYYDRNVSEVVETVDLNTLHEIIKQPPTMLNLVIKGRYFTEALIKAITPAYLRGTKITINAVPFKQCTSNPQYFYNWQNSVPSSLPKELRKLYDSRRPLTPAQYDLFVKWNQSRIHLAIERSKFRWNLAEEFYKDLYKEFTPKGIRIQSPNKKTFFEATAELTLNSVLSPENPLTEAEEYYLLEAQAKNLVRAFGLQDCDMLVSCRHRTTIHGTTNEPYFASQHDLEQARIASSFNRNNNGVNEGFVTDGGFTTKTWVDTTAYTVTSPHRQRQNIETLKWFLSLDRATQSEFLMPGWHFCPVCDRLYHENEGCYDGDTCHIEELTFVPYNENHSEDDCDLTRYVWSELE